MAKEERVRVSGERSVTRLAVDAAAGELGVTVDELRERIRSNTVAHERDEHGRIYVLIGAATNAPDADHSRYRSPRDAAIIEDLREPPAGPPPGAPGEPAEPS